MGDPGASFSKYPRGGLTLNPNPSYLLLAMGRYGTTETPYSNLGLPPLRLQRPESRPTNGTVWVGGSCLGTCEVLEF